MLVRSDVAGVDADGLATWLFDGQVPDRDCYVLGHGSDRDVSMRRHLLATTTKFLYFGGWGARPGRLQPLIMDANVIAALQALTGEQWINGWRVDYVRYLYRAADWAAQLGTTGDVIERGLSEKGSTLLNTRPRVSRN
ncbi:MAG: hypothetical protein JWR37_5012 [Mycobacterium sp.]|nr:hypothetical protein [Mycobacterium sp.]